MKHKYSKLFLTLVGTALLASCTIQPTVGPTSSQDGPAPTSSETPTKDKTVRSYEIINNKDGDYVVGESAYNSHDFALEITYSDNTKLSQSLERKNIKSIKNNRTNQVLIDHSLFQEAGSYTVYLEYNVLKKTIEEEIIIDVKSHLTVSQRVQAFDFQKDVVFQQNKTILESNYDLLCEARYVGGIIEVFPLSSPLIVVKLYKDEVEVPLETTKLENGFLYDLTVTLHSDACSYEVEASADYRDKTKGYYELTKSEIVYSDINLYPVPKGEIKLLVIPIYLQSDNTNDFYMYDFDEAALTKIDKFFFQENGEGIDNGFSLKTYFETTSGHEMQITGEIAKPFHAPKEKYAIENFLVKDEYGYYMRDLLDELFNDAVSFTINNNPNINFDEYDVNDDGYLDCTHFIHNAGDKKFEQSGHDRDQMAIPWACPLWPHQSIISNNPGSLDVPNAYIYESTSLEHLTNATTITHEQGHMFGLPDYYDYSGSGCDYIGTLDMQSGNCFDWNSWSKFSVGWANPIVVTGEVDSVTIDLKSAALTNQCLIIPADITTYNNSAFDEFFMLELFTPDANNQYDWYNLLAKDRPRKDSTTIDAGIRLYHIDSRLIELYVTEDDMYGARYINTREDFINRDFVPGHIDTCCNNTTTYSDYSSPFARFEDLANIFEDYKQLALIQKGKVDTFGIRDPNDRGNNTILVESDLFLTGDSFRFEDYDHFLSKTNKPTETMNNGEVFPYEIHFDSVTRENAKITVTKVK